MKILFIVLIILALLIYVRHQGRKQTAESTTRIPLTLSSKPLTKASHRLPQIAAYTTLVLFLAIGGLFYYLDWKEDHRVMNVRVINTNTGETGSYLAYRFMIQDRSFVTLDGRTITVSNSERVEISAAEDNRFTSTNK